MLPPYQQHDVYTPQRCHCSWSLPNQQERPDAYPQDHDRAVFLPTSLSAPTLPVRPPDTWSKEEVEVAQFQWPALRCLPTVMSTGKNSIWRTPLWPTRVFFRLPRGLWNTGSDALCSRAICRWRGCSFLSLPALDFARVFGCISPLTAASGGTNNTLSDLLYRWK